MSTGTLAAGSQSTRLGGFKPQQTHHAPYNACQFEHMRLCLFYTYEDLPYKQSISLMAACLSKMANLHALGERIVEWLVVRQDCDSNDQHHEHDGQLKVGIQRCGKDLRCCQRQCLQQHNGVPKPQTAPAFNSQSVNSQVAANTAQTHQGTDLLCCAANLPPPPHPPERMVHLQQLVHLQQCHSRGQQCLEVGSHQYAAFIMQSLCSLAAY